MSESEGRSSAGDEEDSLAADIIGAIFETWIEHGTLSVDDRPAEEIVNEFRERVLEWLSEGPDDSEPFEIGVIRDHRSTLLQSADDRFDSGEPEVAVVLWATWIEHHVNDVLLRTMWSLDVGEKSRNETIKTLNLKFKLTALWEILGLPEIDSETLASISEISSYRNSFVHYKWRPVSSASMDPHSDDAKFEDLRARARSVVEKFEALDNELSWKGRKDELLRALKE